MSTKVGPVTRLSATARRFVRDWGELGLRWGMDRSTAEVHALLYISPRGMTAREIAESLGGSDEAVRASVEILHSWGVVRSAAESGGAADEWECLPDVVEMFRAILEARRRSEMDPTLAVLRDTVLRAETDSTAEPHMVRKLEEMQDLFRLVQSFYAAVGTLPTEPTRRMLKLGQKIRQSLGS